MLMGPVHISYFLAIASLIVFQLLTTIFIFYNKRNQNNNTIDLSFKGFLSYWDSNLTIILMFTLVLVLMNGMVSLYITYFLFCLLHWYNESAKLKVDVDGVPTIIIYPMSWYINTITKLTVDYLMSLTLKKMLKETCSKLFKEVKSFFVLSLNDILAGFTFKESTVDEKLRAYEEYFADLNKIFKSKKHVYKSPKPLHEEDEATKKKRLKRFQDNNDPRVMLNRLRRFPIFPVYTAQLEKSNEKFLQHILIFYNFFKSTLVAASLMFLYFIYTVFFFKLQFLKQLSVWFIVGMLFFWLISGFNFFLKRYQFGKFTSAIQRFWKRTNTCFWLIEGFLIFIFFYYYLNSSQEPVYMYDYSSLNQEYLISLQTAGLNIIILSLIIYFMYFTLLRITSNSWVQLNVYILLISVFIFFSFFIESYQFYYIISTFNERLWVFNEEDNLWLLDIENPILRNKHQYLLMCLIAKYWHFLFIFLSWVFFLIKSFERRKYTFVLFGANLQNIVLLYVLNFACYLQWFKWFSRRFLDLPYTWFMTNIDTKLIFRLYSEVNLLIFSSLKLNSDLYVFKNVVYKSLNFWAVDSLTLWKFI